MDKMYQATCFKLIEFIVLEDLYRTYLLSVYLHAYSEIFETEPVFLPYS